MSEQLWWRPMRPSDAGGWADLLAAIRVADHGWEYYTAEDLSEEFGDPDWDLERGSMAASQIHLERFPGRPLSVSARCPTTNAGSLALYERRGYRRARWFNGMTRDLSVSLPGLPELPAVEFLGWGPQRLVDARLIRNEAFRDHWGSTEMNAEGWEHLMATGAFRPECSFLAYSSGEPVGVVISQEYEVGPAAKGRDLYIAIVGTRRVHRNRGIASALLAKVLDTAGAVGFATASLEVDSESPTGAVGLYQRLGFEIEHTSVIMTKSLL
jgi:mycothiol synthase